MHKTKSGFTLVELLIVIVVIAILAAITIVAYNGVQDKARSSSALSDLSSIAKQIELYNAENGSYPSNAVQAKTMNAKTSIDYGVSHVMLCASSSAGFALFINDTSAHQVYEIASGMSPQKLASPPAWTSSVICSTTPYGTVGWGDSWLTN